MWTLQSRYEDAYSCAIIARRPGEICSENISLSVCIFNLLCNPLENNNSLCTFREEGCNESYFEILF